jgi:hypothetical protein
MAKKTRGAKKDRPRERRERRFEPRPSTNPVVVYLLGGVGAIVMGAGAWAQFGAAFADVPENAPEPLTFARYILVAGTLLVGAAIWIGTSGDPALRVGDGGVAFEKSGVRRVPWYAIERIEWREEAVRVIGKDDVGAPVTIVARAATHPQAAAWIVKEARERIPAVVDVPDDATLSGARSDAGEELPLEPPQVVGKHCAESGKVIAYEPDARVCPRCERVYHKAHVPDSCACGASLVSLQAAKTG